MIENKAKTRKESLNKRRALSPETVSLKSKAIKEKLVNTREFKESSIILIYYSVNNEVETPDIIREALTLKKTVALPRVKDKDMDFFIYREGDKLVKSSFNIPEPVNEIKADYKNALVIVPLVAFDKNCNRTGYGGGYYDRFLAKHNVKTIGLAFEMQKKENIYREKFDIALDKIITESNIYERRDPYES